VSQSLLRIQSTGPTARQGKQVERRFRRARCAALRRRLVQRVDGERYDAEGQVGNEHLWRKDGQERKCREKQEKGSGDQQRIPGPRRIGNLMIFRMSRARRHKELHVGSAESPALVRLDGETEKIEDLRTPPVAGELADMHEDLAAAIQGGDEAESPLVVPLR
jgi:hypothetical protein